MLLVKNPIANYNNKLVVVVYFVVLFISPICAENDEILRELYKATDIAPIWARKLSAELSMLSQYARKERIETTLVDQIEIGEETGATLRQKIAEEIRIMMEEKTRAVQSIRNHAEELNSYQKFPLTNETTYDYHDTDNCTEPDWPELDNTKYIEENEFQWNCDRPVTLGEITCRDDVGPLGRVARDLDTFNMDATHDTGGRVSDRQRRNDQLICRNVSFLDRPTEYYRNISFQEHAHFGTNVNLGHSIIKVTNNVFKRHEDVLNGIRMTEALDLTFKCNYRKDPSLTWQYFASQTGFVRYYPATKWSEEDYDRTYDFRIRSWYTEALTPSKDIVILVDSSGSTKGNRRLMSTVIVNNVLDTLTDNDFVNIYRYSNFTAPVVKCFEDTMVQANEENLRLFREQMENYTDEFVSDISLGLEKAFQLLEKHRNRRRRGQNCQQAIFLMTEGLDYEYDTSVFQRYNLVKGERNYGPIRIFTYSLSADPNDAKRMEWIACANMGFYVNVSIPEEVQEKVFEYLRVMSRPVNLHPQTTPEVAWSALYILGADRRLSNWLWKKSEGIRQRKIFINLEKRRLKRLGRIIGPDQKYFTNDGDHPYMQYEAPREYVFLTTVSVPVYDRRPDHMSLLGVAAVDVPIEHFKKLTKPHKIGVNGYAFILTNNGYVLHHPHHRIFFSNNILKPTYNRVDLTEVEITKDTTEPRKFDRNVIKLRENMVLQKVPGNGKLSVKTSIDEMKRLIMNDQHYYYAAIGPFTLAIVLPDKYGPLKPIYSDKRNLTDLLKELKSSRSGNWTYHPEWEYCRHPNTEHTFDLQHILEHPDYHIYCNSELTNYFLRDFLNTKWFADNVDTTTRLSKNIVSVFLSTHSGLTRWKQLRKFSGWTVDLIGRRAIDEDWYKRTVEINYREANMSESFIYSIPLQTKGGEDAIDYDSSLVTATNAVIKKSEKNRRTPVAVIGYQLPFKVLLAYYLELINNSTEHCIDGHDCKITCEAGSWSCFIIDNDGYVFLHHNVNLIGQSLADINMVLVEHLIKDGVLKVSTYYDYQGTCYPPYESDKPFYGPGKDVDPNMKCDTEIKCKTIEFLTHAIKKTTPTPCDIEYKIYHVAKRNSKTNIDEETSSFCTCPYVVKPIENTNLMLVMNYGSCCHFNEVKRSQLIVNEYPKEIVYNTMSMACYIGTQNNYTTRQYKTCIPENPVEFTANEHDRKYCKIL